MSLPLEALTTTLAALRAVFRPYTGRAFGAGFADTAGGASTAALAFAFGFAFTPALLALCLTGAEEEADADTDTAERCRVFALF